MIVSTVPRAKVLVREVWRPLTALFVWDVLVTGFYLISPFHAPALPLTLFGTVLAIFLASRSNSAYARWWEGRVLWGSLINSSRSLARVAITFLDSPDDLSTRLRRSIVLNQIGFVHALRCQLRKLPMDEKVEQFLGSDETAPRPTTQNTANSILEETGRLIAQARDAGLIDTIQQTHFDAMLVDIANAQGGMERLKNTPLPNQYRFFPELFARLFCVVLPIGLVETLGIATPVGSTFAGLMFLAVLAIGDDLVDPFSNTVHDLPLSAMCRTIEANLLEALGQQAPPPLKPARGVLW